MKYHILLIIAVAFTGCKQTSFNAYTAITEENQLSDAERAELHLPSQSEMILATDSDSEFAKTLSPEILKSIEGFFKPSDQKLKIGAARPIGNYILLWIAFPELVDGGADLIFSVKEMKMVGVFFGGYRG